MVLSVVRAHSIVCGTVLCVIPTTLSTTLLYYCILLQDLKVVE